MGATRQRQFINFLQKELSISPDSIAIALRRRDTDVGPLPMILWKYGFVTLDELSQIYDWLEAV